MLAPKVIFQRQKVPMPFSAGQTPLGKLITTILQTPKLDEEEKPFPISPQCPLQSFKILQLQAIKINTGPDWMKTYHTSIASCVTILLVISNSGPKMVLVEQFEQSWCFMRLSPLTIIASYHCHKKWESGARCICSPWGEPHWIFTKNFSVRKLVFPCYHEALVARWCVQRFWLEFGRFR